MQNNIVDYYRYFLSKVFTPTGISKATQVYKTQDTALCISQGKVLFGFSPCS